MVDIRSNFISELKINKKLVFNPTLFLILKTKI